MIDIVESTLPPGAEQTVGTDPTTVDVPAGGTGTDLDGFRFPTDMPTKSPTAPPTDSPTSSPTASPTGKPTTSPTDAPTPTPTGKIKGTVFEDVNNNGVQDPDEPGIPNVDVVITESEGNVFTLTTDETGMYMAEVPEGSTVVDIVESTLPPGAEQTVGTDPTTVDVPAGGTGTDLDGFRFPTDMPTKSPTAPPTDSPTLSPTASPTGKPTTSPTDAPTPTPTGKIKGTVFEDVNNNGVQDPDEPGIPNVDVVITESEGNVFTLTTDETGMYMAEVPKDLRWLTLSRALCPLELSRLLALIQRLLTSQLVEPVQI